MIDASPASLAPAAVVLAGLLSFLSPCVLPLVPAYLAYLSGAAAEGAAAGGPARRRALGTALAFVLGFSTVFVALGASASALGALLRAYSYPLSIVAGLAVMAMGLHFLGAFRIAFLQREVRSQAGGGGGAGPAYVMGLAFAFGWTPCLGPVLAAVLAVAGARANAGEGVALLALYAAGLGVPFLAAALFAGPFAALVRRNRARLALVEKVNGALLVLAGLAFLTGGLASASYWLLETFPALARLG